MEALPTLKTFEMVQKLEITLRANKENRPKGQQTGAKPRGFGPVQTCKVWASAVGNFCWGKFLVEKNILQAKGKWEELWGVKRSARLDNLCSACQILHVQECTQFSVGAVQLAVNKRSIVLSYETSTQPYSISLLCPSQLALSKCEISNMGLWPTL